MAEIGRYIPYDAPDTDLVKDHGEGTTYLLDTATGQIFAWMQGEHSYDENTGESKYEHIWKRLTSTIKGD